METTGHKKIVYLRLPSDLVERIDLAAEEEERSRNKYIERVLARTVTNLQPASEAG